MEGDGRAGSAQFICKSAVDHGPRHDHASYGQGSYALLGSAAKAAFLDQTLLQDALKTVSKARFALTPLRATSVGNATMGQEFSTSSKCWLDR